MHLLWTKKNFNFCTCNKQWFNCNQYLTNTCSVHYGPLLSRSWSNIHNMHCTYFTRKQRNLITMYMYLDLQLKNQCSQWVQISSMLIILISFFGRHFTAGDRHWISIFYIQMTILPQQQSSYHIHLGAYIEDVTYSRRLLKLRRLKSLLEQSNTKGPGWNIRLWEIIFEFS